MTTRAAGVATPRRAWLGLAVLILPVLLVSMDMSVLYLAMPTITDRLDPSGTQQLWILDIYGFLLAGLLVPMGNLGDRIGRRRIMLAGATVFGLASVLAAFAPNAGVLIAARALMGLGGATLLPSSLALISTLFPNPRARATAIGLWTAFFAGGTALGPIIGGTLLHSFWWGAVFLINIPVLLILLLAGPFVLPEHRESGRGPMDLPSVLMSIGGMLPLVYAIKEIAAHGPAPIPAVAGLAGLGVLVAFVRRQRTLAEPLLDLDLFRRPMFRLAIVSSTVGMMSLAAMSYLVGIWLQSVRGHDALSAALLGLPGAIAVFAVSMIGSRVGRRLGTGRAFVVALTVAAVGNLLLLGVGVDGGVGFYIAASILIGIGDGLAFPLVSELAVASVPPERAGSAVGISETSFELGNGLGLALLGSLAALVFRSGGDFAPTLGETLDDAGSDTGLARAASEAFVSGMHVATIAAAVLLAATAIVAWRTARTQPAAAVGVSAEPVGARH
ncbi:MFS transporter [Nocardia stercoris]|uniref:MFS transporter n=1 Tax=Nocardia stercoris TaxID=2483361 RepID=A0A3M2L3V6_9NOCA|nr:MFS transporter [Nocardia stercoris]RMI32231.1 MFS transporter [Nocardia stercoris]